jgi:hypothetical protein
VDGDPLRARHFRGEGGSDWFRFAGLARFAQRGDVIDVDR